jgi:signal transduction histidine kinase
LLQEYCAGVEAQPAAWKLADVATLVDDVLDLQAVVWRAAGVIVNFERERALPWVYLDALKIKQVITNLCKNANEAMPRGGQLTLKVYRAGRKVVLEVRDNGIGVPQGVDVFELFKTTKQAGRGVGLPLAREIISAHGGTIAFTSEAGRGTTFRVSLPIDEYEAGQKIELDSC